MHVSIRLLIECIKTSYRNEVLPHVEEGVASSYARIVAVMLDQLEHRLELEESLNQAEAAQLRQLLGEAPLAEDSVPEGNLLSQLEQRAQEIEELRAKAAAKYSGDFAAPPMQTYLQDQLVRERQLFAMRADDKVY